MVFNSFKYLIFFPIVLLCYYVMPHRMRNPWLLIASYFFYACYSIKYVGILLIATVVTYFAALVISPSDPEAKISRKSNGGGREQTFNNKTVLIISLVFMIGMLFVFKYTGFAIRNINRLLHIIGFKELAIVSIVMPVGISFFTFQTVGYLVDVYKGKYAAERNFINYALFVSFFPQLLSGPIGRGGDLLPQYRKIRKFDLDNIINGGLSFLWGLFLKLVISDRAALLVNTVYDDFHSYTGMAIILATVMYGLQLYTDFQGYSLMAAGSGEMLGIRLQKNFEQPYFSMSIKEFWRRWHMSLSSWLRDYIYFPLGGSRCSTLRKYYNLMMTFFISGVWHGSQWSFIAWGLLHGFYQVMGEILKPFREGLIKKLSINTETTLYKASRMVMTFIMVDFAWLFFRANGFMNALRMIKQAILNFHLLSLMEGGIYSLGLDKPNFSLLMLCTAFLFVVDLATYNGISVSGWFRKQNLVFKDVIIALSILAIMLFGIWGNAYDAASFIYFQF